MMSGETPQHINEVVSVFKKQLTSFSKTYYKFGSELPFFIYKNRIVQADILNDLYEQSSLLQDLLRQVIDNDINGETLRQLSSTIPTEHNPSNCPCPHCNKKHDDDYYEEDGEEEEDE